MAVSESDLKFYLTAYDPISSQSEIAQSLGRYPSTTEVLLSSFLSSDVSFGSSTLTVSAGANVEDVMIGAEIITLSGSGNTRSIVSRGSYGTDELFHASG